jgi:hypothetical protein
MVLHDDAVVQHRNHRLLGQFALIVPARRFEDDVVGLPFTRGLAGIHQRRRLAINRARLPIGIGPGLIGIQHLHLIHAVDENTTVAAALAGASGWQRRGKLDVQLKVRPLPACADALAPRSLHVAVPHRPRRLLALGALPLGQVFSIKEHLGVGWGRSVLAECRARCDHPGLRAVRVVQMPLAAR